MAELSRKNREHARYCMEEVVPREQLQLEEEEAQRVIEAFQQICLELELQLMTQIPSYRMNVQLELLQERMHDVVNKPDMFAIDNPFFRDEAHQRPLFAVHRTSTPTPTSTPTFPSAQAPAVELAATIKDPPSKASIAQIQEETQWVEKALRDRIEVLKALGRAE